MNVIYRGRRYQLRDRDLLGEGGEARVYAMGALAAKVYQLPEAEREDRLDKLRAFPRGLPSGLVAPAGLLSDEGGRAVGFAMERVQGREIRWLGRRAWREGRLGRAQVCRIFADLHRLLSALHAAGVVAGDLNCGNVLFEGERVWLIDADSVQLGGWPCPVADERILDPALYGVELAAAPAFSPETDWYAFAVLLFESLLYVHPYGGVKKGCLSLLERARGRHSVLRADVARPKAAADPELLPEALLQHFARIFERGERGVFPAELLALGWTECACGAEHGQAVCPACAVRVPRPPVVRRGRCAGRRVLRTSGCVLAAAVQGGALHYLLSEKGTLRREDGSAVAAGDGAGVEIHLAGRTTWLVSGGEAVQLQAGRVLARHAVGTCRGFPAGPPAGAALAGGGALGGAPAFAAFAGRAWAVRGEWLVELPGGRASAGRSTAPGRDADRLSAARPLGQVLEDQTWIAAGASIGFGAWRVGRLLMGFTFRSAPGSVGLRPVSLPPVAGRLVELAVSFDGLDVLLGVAAELGGRRTHALYLIRGGAVIASRTGGADDPALAGVRGLALHRGRVLVPTDGGLLVLAARGDRLAHVASFPEAEPFVRAGAALLPGTGGALYAVTPREITHLTLT